MEHLLHNIFCLFSFPAFLRIPNQVPRIFQYTNDSSADISSLPSSVVNGSRSPVGFFSRVCVLKCTQLKTVCSYKTCSSTWLSQFLLDPSHHPRIFRTHFLFLLPEVLSILLYEVTPKVFLPLLFNSNP